MIIKFKKMKRTIIVAVALLLSVVGLKAQTAELDKYKSLFTLNFIRYIGWPEEAKQGDFVIGVLKNGQLADQLKANTTGKKFGYQNIVVKEFKKIEEVSDCQILYVGNYSNYSKNASALASKLNNKNSLIITESEGAINNGSMINFVIVDNKLKFEISSNNASSFGLELSNSLTSMTQAIKR